MHDDIDSLYDDAGSAGRVVTAADLTQLEKDLRAHYDDTLAGLLRQGTRLLDSSEPGVALLIAHAGRELSHGVRRRLLVDEGVARTLKRPRDEGERTAHRDSLAAVLGLPPDHALVMRWSDAFDSLMPIVHYNGELASHETAVAGFRDIASVIFSLVGRFATMKRELQALADIVDPSPREADRAVHLLMRAQQRAIFYSRVASPHWLPLLVERDQFKSLPDRTFTGDTWWMGPWPEREYLIRVAAAIPEKVRDIFLSVPAMNTNPRVWSAAAEAARRMPAVIGATVARQLATALPRVPPLLLARQSMHLAVELARTEPDAALAVLDALLTLRRFEVAFPQPEEPDIKHGLGRGTNWMLTGLERHDLDDVARSVIPAVAAAGPLNLVRLLASRLRFAMIQMRKMETGVKHEDHSSLYWCENLEWRKNALDSGDIRAVLATALWRVLSVHCASSPELAISALDILSGHSDDVFIRLRLKLAAQSSHATTTSIDQLLTHPFMLASHDATLEIREFLGSRFRVASPEARAAFMSRIEQGPSDEDVLAIVAGQRSWDAHVAGEKEYLRPESLDETEESERVRAKQAWQARQLALFDAFEPEEAAGLVAALRAAGAVALEADIASGTLNVGLGPTEEPNPSSVEAVFDDLTERSNDEIALLCLSFAEEPKEEPSKRIGALVDALQSVLTSKPERVGALLEALLRAGVEPRYVSVVTDAMLSLARQKQVMPWPDLLRAGPPLLARVTERVVEQADVATSSNAPWGPPSEADAWRRTVESFLNALKEGIGARLLPIDLGGELAKVLDDVVEFWSSNHLKASSVIAYPEKRRLSMGETMADVVVDVIASSSYWFSALQEGREQADVAPDPTLAIGTRLDRLLQVPDTHRRSLIDAIGDVLPFLLSAERDWIVRHRTVLFVDANLESILRSTLTRFWYYRETFEFVRPELVRLTALLARSKAASAETSGRENVLVGGLVARVSDGWLDGRVTANDEDGLALGVFELGSKRAKNRAYWGIYHGWTDAKEPVSEVAVQRCLALWRWRLDVLDKKKPSETRAWEAAELLWLLTTPYLPIPDVLDLASRTLRLAPTRMPPLSRLSHLIAEDPIGAYDLFATMARNSMATRSKFLDFDDVAEAFRFVLAGDDAERRDEARVLLDQLGRRYDSAFADLA